MENRLFVGNLPFALDEARLRSLFEEVGTVESAVVCLDRETRRPRGFGFVTMSSDAEALLAVSRLSGHSVNGRQLVVNVARPREFTGGRR